MFALPKDISLDYQVEQRLAGIRSAVIVKNAETDESDDSFEEDVLQFDNLDYYQPGLIFHRGQRINIQDMTQCKKQRKNKKSKLKKKDSITMYEKEIDGILKQNNKAKKRKSLKKDKEIAQSTQQIRDTNTNTEISKGQ